VVWSALYDSFGNVQIETAEVVNNLRFAGQYHDGETGLYYNLNRYYDPKIGRYLRTDPFGEGLNLYAYVFNNPNSLIDPLGLCVYNKVSGWVHGGLAVIGLVPLLGIVPDLIDAGLYLLEAEYGDAALAGIGAIPIAGYFGRAAQYGVKGVKRLLKNEKFLNFVNSAWRVVDNEIGTIGDFARAPNSANSILVLGRGTPDELKAIADKVGGYVINTTNLDRKQLFKHIYSEMRKSNKIIQVVDDIPIKQVAGQKTGQWSRAEKIFIDQNPEKFEKKVRRVRRSDFE
jgi:RHS repeat-associated protein